jgi:PAS domain S-box-containing protein
MQSDSLGEGPAHMSVGLWKAVVDSVPVCAVIASRSLEGTIQYVNDEFTLVTGYQLADVPTVADWIRLAYPDPAYRAVVLTNWARDVSPGHMRSDVSYDVVCKDGSIKRLLLRANMLDDEYMIVTMLDVSRQFETEEQLRCSEARYRELVESSPVPICLARGGKIVFLNAAAAELFGAKSVEQIVGRVAMDFVHLGSRDEARRALSTLSEVGTAVRTLYTIVRLDGTLREVEAAAVVTDFDGEPTNLALFHDVTERNEAERARLVYEAKLQQSQRVEGLGLLAAGVAHEFNNILVGILGSVSLALVGEPDAQTRQQLLRIDESARRAAELASQMLACSGRATAEPENVDMHALLVDMNPLFHALVREPIQISVEAEAGRHLVFASATQVRQILLSLMSNAAEALHDAEGGLTGGRITIRMHDHEQVDEQLHGAVASEPLAPGRYVLVEVEDDGPGMSEETVSRIFEPFFSTKFAGRGLGLAAVHGIVRGNRGTIAVDSQLGRGSTFRVYFPAADTASVLPGEAQPPRGGPDDRGVVLIIDDESIVREVAASMIEALGFEVLSAASGQEGIDVFAAHANDISLVIVDMNMPGVDGIAVCRAVRGIRASVPVVLSSGFGEEETATHIRESGFAGFLRKPFDLHGLREVVEDARAKRGAGTITSS